MKSDLKGGTSPMVIAKADAPSHQANDDDQHSDRKAAAPRAVESRELVPQFQNGTEKPPTIEELARRYKTGGGYAVQALLVSCVALRAAERFSATDFTWFCEEVGLDPNGQMRKKWSVIGKEADRFQPHIAACPCSATGAKWTTMYALAKLKREEFERVVKDTSFGPKMTTSDIDLILKRSKKPKAAKPRAPPSHEPEEDDGEATLTISLVQFGDEVKLKIVEEIKKVERRWKFAIKYSQDLIDVMEDHDDGETEGDV